MRPERLPLRDDAPVTPGRDGRFELAFGRNGAETRIARQFVSYPFHLTRPFRLDPAIPSLTTLYQQSSSGGLYRADRLQTRLSLWGGTAVHVTTQAATIVHDCRGEPARQEMSLDIGQDAFLALTPDPLVLLPGAASRSRTEIRLAPGAAALIQESFSPCVPEGAGGTFDRIAGDISVRGPDGRLLVRDAIAVSGAEFAACRLEASGWKVVSSFLLLGEPARLPDADRLAAVPGGGRSVTGVSALPNGMGWSLRTLAASAVEAKAVAEHVFACSVRAALGADPAPRRK